MQEKHSTRRELKRRPNRILSILGYCKTTNLSPNQTILFHRVIQTSKLFGNWRRPGYNRHLLQTANVQIPMQDRPFGLRIRPGAPDALERVVQQPGGPDPDLEPGPAGHLPEQVHPERGRLAADPGVGLPAVGGEGREPGAESAGAAGARGHRHPLAPHDVLLHARQALDHHVRARALGQRARAVRGLLRALQHARALGVLARRWRRAGLVRLQRAEFAD